MTNQNTSSDELVQGSFSVFTKGDGDNISYFRLGSPNPYLPDGSRAKTMDGSGKFGAYLFVDGKKDEVVHGPALTMRIDDDKRPIVFEFKHQWGGGPHSTSWSRATATDIKLSSACTLTHGFACDVNVGVKQTASLAATFAASAGISVAAKLDLAVDINASTLGVKHPWGGYTWSPSTDIRGAVSASLTHAGHDVAHLAHLQVACRIMQGLTLAMSALTGAAMTAQDVMSWQKTTDSSRNDDATGTLAEMAILTGISVRGMASLAQAIGLALGIAALVKQKAAKALDQAFASQVAVTQSMAQIRVGPTSYIQVDPLQIVISAPTIWLHGTMQNNQPQTPAIAPFIG